jgi:hypothetical protein
VKEWGCNIYEGKVYEMGNTLRRRGGGGGGGGEDEDEDEEDEKEA